MVETELTIELNDIECGEDKDALRIFRGFEADVVIK